MSGWSVDVLVRDHPTAVGGDLQAVFLLTVTATARRRVKAVTVHRRAHRPAPQGERTQVVRRRHCVEFRFKVLRRPGFSICGAEVDPARVAHYFGYVPRRLMFVQLKSGFDVDRGPSWIGWVDFTTSWNTARFHGRELRREQGPDSNFHDVETDEWFWLSGPKRNRTDTRYGPAAPEVDEDAREAYADFLAGASLPGRERG
jgi:hypothetical protein